MKEQKSEGSVRVLTEACVSGSLRPRAPEIWSEASVASIDCGHPPRRAGPLRIPHSKAHPGSPDDPRYVGQIIQMGVIASGREKSEIGHQQLGKRLDEERVT